MAGTADDGRKDGSGSIISGKPSLAHSRSVVNDKGSNIFVTHLVVLVLLGKRIGKTMI